MHTFTTYPVKLFSVLVLAGGVMLGGMIGNAQAGDKKIYNGALCHPQGGNLKTASITRGRGFISNHDPEKPLYVECPVTRDNTRKGIKEWGFHGHVGWIAGEPIKCTMSSRFYPTGQVVDSESGILVAPAGKIVTKRIRVTTGPKKYGQTYLSLSCTIPQRGKHSPNVSSLRSYYVEEY